METILNTCNRFKDFVYQQVQWQTLADGEKIIMVQLRAREKRQGQCSICQLRCPGYDRLAARSALSQDTSVLQAVCSDMWKPYLKVIVKKGAGAIIILDRFHIMKHFNEAIDTMRRQEARQLAKDGYAEILKNARWPARAKRPRPGPGCLLKSPNNQTSSQLAKLKELVKYNLKTMKCRLLRDAFQKFCHYHSVTWAHKFLQQWTACAMRSRLGPMKKVARMLRAPRPVWAHETLILNWFRVSPRLSNGIVEGFNNKAKLVMRKAYGFKEFETIEVMLYHSLANLPMPPLTHRFL